MNVPRCLYGDALTTRSLWSKLHKQAWSEGGWDTVVSGLEMVDTEILKGALLIGDTEGLAARREEHFRLHWISAFRTHSSLRHFPTQADLRERSLILQGMKYDLFALPMLVPNNCCAAFVPNATFVSDFVRPMTDWYIHWLPTYWSLREKVCHALADWIVPYYDKDNPGDYIYLWNYLFVFLQLSGKAPEYSEMQQRVDKRYNGDVIGALLDMGIVERRGEGFALPHA
jgi:hypothetical protein